VLRPSLDTLVLILRGHLGWRSAMVEEKALSDGHLSGLGVAHSTLLFPGEGCGTLALLRGDHDNLDGGESRNQRGG
jgi:hypothetical protein